MSECEHQNCTTPFCPYCGKAIGLNPLAGLRAHMVRRIDFFETRVSTLASESPMPSHIDRQLESARTALEKWREWLRHFDALRLASPISTNTGAPRLALPQRKAMTPYEARKARREFALGIVSEAKRKGQSTPSWAQWGEAAEEAMRLGLYPGADFSHVRSYLIKLAS